MIIVIIIAQLNTDVVPYLITLFIVCKLMLKQLVTGERNRKYCPRPYTRMTVFTACIIAGVLHMYLTSKDWSILQSSYTKHL